MFPASCLRRNNGQIRGPAQFMPAQAGIQKQNGKLRIQCLTSMDVGHRAIALLPTLVK
jgi:hypothetical protein